MISSSKLVLPNLLLSLCIIIFLVTKAQNSCLLGLSFLFSFLYSSSGPNLPFLLLHRYWQYCNSSHTSDVTTASQPASLISVFSSLVYLYQIFLLFSPIKCSDHVISSGWGFQWAFVPISVLNCKQHKWTLVHWSRRGIYWNDNRKLQNGQEASRIRIRK